VTEEGTENKKRRSEMSRGAQTAWIVCTIILVGLALLYQMSRLPSDHTFAKCQTLFGRDEICESTVRLDAEIKRRERALGIGG
jgi:hypothetical protein